MWKLTEYKHRIRTESVAPSHFYLEPQFPFSNPWFLLNILLYEKSLESDLKK